MVDHQFPQHLHSLTVPGKEPTACTWEGRGSLRLALAIESYIYFTNLRLQYKWAYCASNHTLVYAFSRSDLQDKYIMFWNIKRGTVSFNCFDFLSFAVYVSIDATPRSDIKSTLLQLEQTLSILQKANSDLGDPLASRSKN